MKLREPDLGDINHMEFVEDFYEVLEKHGIDNFVFMYPVGYKKDLSVISCDEEYAKRAVCAILKAIEEGRLPKEKNQKGFC